MPNSNEQKKLAPNPSIATNVQVPQPGILRRLFGDPVSEKTAKEWPALQAAYAGRQIERPDLDANVTSVKPMGWWSKFRYPDAYAVTSPFGGIQLNRELIENDKQDLNDVLIHEMTHAGQGIGRSIRQFYDPRRDENQAINAEGLRKVRKTDIPLRGK